jgi:crossover junction endodeoxyribonuclease RuvC
MIITALDLSLTGTGICRVNGGDMLTVETVSCPRLTGNARLQFVLDRCIRAAVPGADLVVIESPAYGKQGGQQGHHERAGLWWLVVHTLWREDIPYVTITPGGLKKYATGSGAASKDAVLIATVKRYGHLVDVADNNQADAVILAAMAQHHYGAPLTKVPALNAKALEAVTWPELKGVNG